MVQKLTPRLSLRRHAPEWYDVAQRSFLGLGYYTVTRAVRYLELKGELERHPDPNLVRKRR